MSTILWSFVLFSSPRAARNVLYVENITEPYRPYGKKVFWSTLNRTSQYVGALPLLWLRCSFQETFSRVICKISHQRFHICPKFWFWCLPLLQEEGTPDSTRLLICSLGGRLLPLLGQVPFHHPLDLDMDKPFHKYWAVKRTGSAAKSCVETTRPRLRFFHFGN
jgi:hypothetical protein